MMQGALAERDKCISYLKGQLSESYDVLGKLKKGEVVADDQGSLICIGGASDEALLILGHRAKELEANLEDQFEPLRVGLCSTQDVTRMSRLVGVLGLWCSGKPGSLRCIGSLLDLLL
jgi:hypothetical protein